MNFNIDRFKKKVVLTIGSMTQFPLALSQMHDHSQAKWQTHSQTIQPLWTLDLCSTNCKTFVFFFLRKFVAMISIWILQILIIDTHIDVKIEHAFWNLNIPRKEESDDAWTSKCLLIDFRKEPEFYVTCMFFITCNIIV